MLGVEGNNNLNNNPNNNHYSILGTKPISSK